VPLRSSSSHVLYPTFGGATTSTIPLHSVSLRRLHSTAFQQYYVCRPLFFSGCSFAQPSGLAPLALCPKSRNSAEKAVDFYFFPAVSRSQYFSPLHPAEKAGLCFVPVLRWLFDCRNPATALLEK
jgi:hypothetical protein